MPTQQQENSTTEMHSFTHSILPLSKDMLVHISIFNASAKQLIKFSEANNFLRSFKHTFTLKICLTSLLTEFLLHGMLSVSNKLMSLSMFSDDWILPSSMLLGTSIYVNTPSCVE